MGMVVLLFLFFQASIFDFTNEQMKKTEIRAPKTLAPET